MAPKGQILPGTSQAKGPNAGRQLWSGQRRVTLGGRADDRGGGPSSIDRAGSPTMTHFDSPFAARHIGPSTEDVSLVLAAVGYGSIDEMMDVAIPDTIRFHGRLGLPDAATEAEAVAELRALADHNKPLVSMIGLGYYGTQTPAVIRRNVLEDPAWYTAYTPYQPEISQGRLEALLNFQTMVTDLTGLTTANASMLDEGTAVAEAMTLARRSSRSKSSVYVVDADTLPQTLAVLRTRAEPLGIRLALVDLDAGDALPAEYFGLHLQYP